jgi:hypothetical protein
MGYIKCLLLQVACAKELHLASTRRCPSVQRGVASGKPFHKPFFAHIFYAVIAFSYPYRPFYSPLGPR